MRLKFMLGTLWLVVSLTNIFYVAAQNPSVEWLNWDAIITTQANSTELAIVETQTVLITNGSLQSGQRNYSQLVNIQRVYITLNNTQAEQLSQGNGEGTYQITNTNGTTVLSYQLPEVLSTNEQFTLQINYTTNSATAGVIGWFIVPGAHEGSVASSTVTIHFPDGQAPDVSSIQIPQGTGSVTTSGDSIMITSRAVIPTNQAFEIQLPYSASGNTTGNSNNPINPVETAPAGNSFSNGLGLILLVFCIVGAVLILGVVSLVRGLFGGLGGLLSGNRTTNNPVGGGSSFGDNPGSPQGGGSSFGHSSTQGRGFRESANQNRELPPLGKDKDAGGSASFK